MNFRIIITILVLIGADQYVLAQAEKLQITILGIKEAKGSILVGLFDTESEFLKKAIKAKTVKAAAGKVTVVFEDLPAGEYAISVIHDENENGEIDSNFIGIPTEGFAFGNDAMGTFGPPSFDKAKVTWNGRNLVVELKLKYF